MKKLVSDLQAAYLAGLVDGEGSLECQKQMQPNGKTPRYVLRLSFCFATPEPLATVSEWLGLDPSCYPSTDPKRSDRHRLHIPKGIVVPLLNQMLPHLILKRRQAEIVLAIEKVRASSTPNRSDFRRGSKPMPQSAVNAMEALFLELRSLKSNKRQMHARVNLMAA